MTDYRERFFGEGGALRSGVHQWRDGHDEAFFYWDSGWPHCLHMEIYGRDGAPLAGFAYAPTEAAILAALILDELPMGDDADLEYMRLEAYGLIEESESRKHPARAIEADSEDG